jgi:hypothetical protein
MFRCTTTVRAMFLAALVMVLPSRDARADLIDYGGGLVYDTVQDLTWLDPSFANPPHTSMLGDPLSCGSSLCDWYYTWAGATAWVDGLSYQGYDDWRLPSTSYAYGGGDNEWRKALQQLSGWEFEPTLASAEEFRLVTAGERGPFQDNPSYEFVWVNAPYVYTSQYAGGGYDIPDRLSAGRDIRAVRQGRPVSRIPEPTTLALVGLGALAVGVTRLRSWRRGA